MTSAMAIRHVAFEDLGAFAPVLSRRGYEIAYRDAGIDDLKETDPVAPDLLVVLGGPIGAYEEDAYPFIRDELAFIERRIAARRPTIGICLGAQLIARAIGAREFPSGVKEIGFAAIRLTEAGRGSCLAAYAAEPVALHWHGDTFELPESATRLALTDTCENQAFALGRHVIAFQFHPEAGAGGFERWLIGHAVEIAAAGIAPRKLRAEAEHFAPELARKAERTLIHWLDGLSS